MKKVVLFVVLDRYADWEAAYLAPLLRSLSQDEIVVKTLSPTKDGVTSIGGFTLLPDYDIASAPTDFEGLILIGGMSWRNEEAGQVRPLVQQALDKGKLVGAICDATVFLGAMGALNEVRHTSNDVDDLKQWAQGAYSGETRYVRQQAVRDRNIVTANGTATLEFAREVLTALNVAPASAIDAWYAFYKRGCYEAPMPVL